MSLFKFANFIATELEEGISAGALEMNIPLAASEALPTLGVDEIIRLVLWDGQQAPEIVTVTENPQTGVLTITRAAEDTTAKAWAAGTQVKCVLTAEIINAALEAFFDLGTVLEEAFLPLAGGTLTGPLILAGAPTDALHAATKLYVDSIGSGFLATTGGTLSGALLMGGNAISGLATPTTASSAATKAYVDSAVSSGIKWKDPVRVATTADGTFSSAFDDGSTVDDIVLATGDRILIKNQSDATQNGIYVVAASGAPTRATDADANDEVPGATVFVEEGTANAATQWTCTNTSVTLGSTNIAFSLIAAGILYSADDVTLQLSGTVFSVKNGGIAATQLAADAVTTAKILNSNVTTDKIADINVTTAKIADNAITTAKILDANVTFAKLASAVLASQAEAEAGTSSTKLMTPQRVTQQIAKAQGVIKAAARVTNNGSAALVTGSFGVTSVSRTAQGEVTVTFSTAFANTNYKPVGAPITSDAGRTIGFEILSTTQMIVHIHRGSNTDGLIHTDDAFTFMVLD